MKAEFKFENTDAVEATLSITMTLGDWKRLRKQLSSEFGAYPSWKVIGQIDKMIAEVEQRFSGEFKDE